jgi:iron complex outermembrane receptor protein
MSPFVPTPLRTTLLVAALALVCRGAWAQATQPTPPPPAPAVTVETEPTPAVTRLPTVEVEASAVPGVTPGRITSTTKGDTRPLENPQSITVVTRERLDQTQVKTLVEALSGVAGVVSGERGNRGFDDFGIRGAEVGNNQEKYIDGLDTMRSGYLPAEEIFGAERIEILKGSASLLFGRVRPGGLINIVSKRPRPEAFGALGVTVGNLGFREVTADLGRPVPIGRGLALRVAALISDSDDATDHVFFKNRYVAPSLSVALGARTDLTILTSYLDRAWLRNQGLAAKGTVLPNINGPIDRSLFIGDPAFGHNDAHRGRAGYALEHRFGQAWQLTQNFRWEKYEMSQRNSAFHGTVAADERTQARTGNIQQDDYQALALDTYLNGQITSPLGRHAPTFGLDASYKRGRLTALTCAAGDLGPVDLYAPVYGLLGGSTPCTGAGSDNAQDIKGLGVYARDRLAVGRRLHVTYGLRHDRIATRTRNNVSGAVDEPRDGATTGMLGAVFELIDGVGPYASIANSFLPVSGVDRNGAVFEPERGRQIEAGVKLERNGGNQVASLAAYDLRRSNVLTPDPMDSAFNVQTAEQRTKGLEAELAADLRYGFNITAAYAFADARVTRSNTAGQVGRTVNNVPRHVASAWVMYRVATGALAGWGLGAGLRGVSERTGYSYTFTIPGYTVFDAGLQYESRGWRATLNVRNLADKTIYSGSFSNDLVTLGGTRQVRFNLLRAF